MYKARKQARKFAQDDLVFLGLVPAREKHAQLKREMDEVSIRRKLVQAQNAAELAMNTNRIKQEFCVGFFFLFHSRRWLVADCSHLYVGLVSNCDVTTLNDRQSSSKKL